ncbi:MAG: amidohydrolase family protein [Acidimicrobiia bacterium]
MPVIDVHAHVSPDRYKEAIRSEGSWYGLSSKEGELEVGGFAKATSERLKDMDLVGVDMQLLSPAAGFFQYQNDLETTKAIAKECNDEIASMVAEHPSRFAGLGTLPMQDISSAISEMERIVGEKGLRGVEISDHVLGRTYDLAEFRPFFRVAEELGAVIFFHQASDTCVHERIPRYRIGNSVGNLAERTVLFATLVFGGVMDYCPALEPILAHGGGYTAFGITRMDKVAGALDRSGTDLMPPFPQEGDGIIGLRRPPSDYLSRFYYDCCVYRGSVLRFLVEVVGADRVVLGTDYPAPMVLPDAVNWVLGLDELTEDEKRAILADNATRLLHL